MTITLTINAENGAELAKQLQGFLTAMQIGEGTVSVAREVHTSGYAAPVNPNAIPPADVEKPKQKRVSKKMLEKQAADQANLAASPPAITETAPASPATQARTEAVAKTVAPKADEPITLAACQALALEVSSKKGMQPARDIILSFNVARISELKPEQYGDMYAKLKAKLEE